MDRSVECRRILRVLGEEFLNEVVHIPRSLKSECRGYQDLTKMISSFESLDNTINTTEQNIKMLTNSMEEIERRRIEILKQLARLDTIVVQLDSINHPQTNPEPPSPARSVPATAPVAQEVPKAVTPSFPQVALAVMPKFQVPEFITPSATEYPSSSSSSSSSSLSSSLSSIQSPRQVAEVSHADLHLPSEQVPIVTEEAQIIDEVEIVDATPVPVSVEIVEVSPKIINVENIAEAVPEIVPEEVQQGPEPSDSITESRQEPQNDDEQSSTPKDNQ